MGLFDNLKVEMKIEGNDYQDIVFQTKSLDHFMDYFVIDKDGKLWILKYELVKDEKKKKKDKFDFGYKRINEHFEEFYYHGTIHFYDYHSINSPKKNIDFIAIYNEGKLKGIYPATENGQRIYTEINGVKFLAISEMNNYDSDFIQKYSEYIINYYVKEESNKLFKFLGIIKHRSIRGIAYSVYELYRQEKDKEFQEYINSKPFKEIKSKVKKKVK